jgi:uncharacterized protein (DUF1778 family)
MNVTSKQQTRFDARLPKHQKDLFEKAARLGGFRNLTDFMIHTLQNKAEQIIQTHERILADQQDALVFFNAITQAPKPNKALKTAAKKYQQQSHSK